ncbi:energy-coupling factor ABC transporter ATP-binding protein [Ferrimonas senticii]|uniref:energy-coupling factor ABC transporter ATP-binding protein n=1 Tax=Ferrimonas senticii TaxID=394566 RepID=UPI0004227479|nr:ABC transporter ATP-binding protein [Ferrimonas senticii]
MLSIKQLRFAWLNQADDCLQLDNLTVAAGEHIGIVGNNGAGKSTLLKLLAGLLKPRQGQIQWHSQTLATLSARERCQLVGILLQEPEQQLLYSDIASEIGLVLRQQRLSRDAIATRVNAVISQLGLSDVAEQHPLDLDAGQRRLVTLAGVLVAEPALLLLDEPSRDFDRHHLALLEQQLAAQQQQGRCIISISHDLDFVARNCDRVWHLDRGQLLACGEPMPTLSHPSLQQDTMLAAPTLWSLRRQLSPHFDKG